MKNLLVNLLGQVGLVIYYIIAGIVRIPVALVLLVVIVFYLLVFIPIAGGDTPKWANHLYDWYCGK